MAKDTYSDKLKALSEKVKEPAKTPIQEVRPVEPISLATKTAKADQAKDIHLNFWVSADLGRRLKIFAATTGKTIKEMGAEALEEYLRMNKG